MVRADDIRDLRTASPDYEETERLKMLMGQLRGSRDPFYLAGADLDPIFRWKLTNQYERNRRFRDTNTDSAYRTITQAAFAVRESDADYEAELRLGILASLRGVGVPVASAILALVEPERYCAIDFRGWRVVFGEERRSFTVQQYLRYRREVSRLAAELGWPVQETDLAVWEYDRRASARG